MMLRRLIAAVAMLCLPGCFSPVATVVPERTLARSGDYVMIERLAVPDVEGVEGCGAQALATVLAHLDPALDAEALAAGLPWHDFGATPVDLLLEARRRGFEARLARGSWEDLVAHARARRPVLVMIDAAYEVRTLTARLPTPQVMHWAVVSGAERAGSRLLLGAPRGHHHRVRRADFLRRWARSDHCLIVVGP